MHLKLSFQTQLLLGVLAVLIFLVVTTEAGKYGDKWIKTPARIHVRYSEGWKCRKGKENKNGCEKFAFGEGDFNILKGDYAFYSFNTTEHKGFASDEDKADENIEEDDGIDEDEPEGENAPAKKVPIKVEGHLAALWMEAFDKPDHKNHWVSGIFWNDYPTLFSQQLWIQEGKYFRMDIYKSEWSRFTDYRWVEVAIFGSNPRKIHIPAPQQNETAIAANATQTETVQSEDIKSEL